MSRTINDELLPHIRVVQQKESEQNASFKCIWDACLPLVRSAIIEVGLQGPDIDDAIQNTFIALWRKLAMYDPEKSSICTYARTIARNRAIELLRGNGRRMKRDLRYDKEAFTEETSIQTPTPNGYDTYELLNKLVDAGWGGIDIVIIRSFARGESLSEIALKLNLPTPTVKTRWFRFRKLFKEQYGHLFSD